METKKLGSSSSIFNGNGATSNLVKYVYGKLIDGWYAIAIVVFILLLSLFIQYRFDWISSTFPKLADFITIKATRATDDYQDTIILSAVGLAFNFLSITLISYIIQNLGCEKKYESLVSILFYKRRLFWVLLLISIIAIPLSCAFYGNGHEAIQTGLIYSSMISGGICFLTILRLLIVEHPYYGWAGVERDFDEFRDSKSCNIASSYIMSQLEKKSTNLRIFEFAHLVWQKIFKCIDLYSNSVELLSVLLITIFNEMNRNNVQTNERIENFILFAAKLLTISFWNNLSVGAVIAKCLENQADEAVLPIWTSVILFLITDVGPAKELMEKSKENPSSYSALLDMYESTLKNYYEIAYDVSDKNNVSLKSFADMFLKAKNEAEKLIKKRNLGKVEYQKAE